MKTCTTFALIFFVISNLFAQKKQGPPTTLQDELAGTWMLVSVTNIYPDGSRVYPYGDNPKGVLTFDKQANYTIQIYKADRPKVASGDKNTATAEERTLLIQGSNAHFGKYIVNETAKTITFKVEHASFPNWEGEDQERNYTFTGNEIKYVVTHTTQGGKAVIAEVAWRRL